MPALSCIAEAEWLTSEVLCAMQRHAIGYVLWWSHLLRVRLQRGSYDWDNHWC